MRVLVTGGTGTFGRAFIRRALDRGVSAVISFSRDEQKAAAMVDEFGGHQAFKAFLGDVRDQQRLRLALRGVDVVVHAAALKRVDVGAYSPSELIATNIIGSMNVVNEAIAAGVSRVVVLSSDKAVAPTNLYGATKACAETYATQANSYGYPSGTLISAVRYGNILGSRGSVIHIWREQVRSGRTLTLTDERMSRFVMTIEQACELVEYALDCMQGGEVFVPRLPSARVIDLAKAVAPDGYPMVQTGLRPGGEKMSEALLNGEEGTRTRKVAGDAPYLAIAPSHHEWTPPGHVWYGSVETLGYGYTYSSDMNDRWLSVDELRALIGATEACR